MGVGGRASIIDWSVLERVVGANDALRDRLLASFVAESARDFERLETALAARAFAEARAVAHQLSGAARVVGALSLADVARALEQEAPYDSDLTVERARAALREQLTLVHERIRAASA